MGALLGIAAASNFAVALITLAIHGWNASGAHAAARNTARFSSLWFLVAFAAPRLVRVIRGLPPAARLTHAFVAAHLVHFATVAALIASFETAHLTNKPAQSAAILLIGFSLVVGAGLTAAPRESRFHRVVGVLHSVTMYSLFLIFFIAFARNPVKPLRLLGVLLALALVLRLSSGWAYHTARVKSVN